MNDFNRFAFNPTSIDVTRSRFDRSFDHKTSFNAGDLIPIYCDELVPGDTFSVDTACVVRMSTPIHPVMDNAYMDIYYFFVPNRLVWDHWREFMGENTDGPWAQMTEYTVPQIKVVHNKKGSIYDQFGLPIWKDEQGTSDINALPIRAYALIWNEWFRDQNVSAPLYIDKGDSSITAVVSGNDYSWFHPEIHDDMVTNWHYGRPLPVAKIADYFTSALPQPQKGPAVTLPLAEVDEIPVYASATNHIEQFGLGPHGTQGLNVITNDQTATPQQLWVFDTTNSAKPTPVHTGGVPGSFDSNSVVIPSNLVWGAQSLSAISVNTLRQAFALQKMFEKDARGGTRYTEIIKSHFGVTSPDARQQRPEYLSGRRIPINISQVLQTSETTSTSPQGNTAAYSLTQDRSSSFTYSATEHGYIIGLACIRTAHTYQQGVNRLWSRKRRYDFYDPLFANLGEQAIYNKELYSVDTSSSTDAHLLAEEVFGYQEYAAEYRYKPSTVAGALRSTYAQSLDVWHYGDDFTETPTLSPAFIYETRENVDRTLAIQSTVEDQFICDFYFKNICVRPMPMYSIPGLIDHH